METIGIIRRIDNLGRVVLPKEIRKGLNIKPGEQLEIFSNSDEITIKKHNQINKSRNFLNYFINTIKMILKCDIYITNLDSIISSTKKNLINQVLIVDLSQLIKLNNNNISITKDLFLGNNYIINPIILNGDPEGYIIFDFNNIKIDESIGKTLSVFVKTIESMAECY